MLRYILVLTACTFLMSFNIWGQSNPDFVLPMKIQPLVSGSFGELRPNHFHSGLDLTTSGKTGYRIYASDRGSVSRIKVSPGGYGKALYIDHPSGHTTVYAHLERFADKIEALVKAKQYEEQSFSVELFFEDGELPVERGEVVAFSGNSGSSGGPHLHYEIRDKATQKPTDPLFYRDDIPDNVKPQIQGVKLYAISDDATVKGQRQDYYSPTVKYDGQFHPKGWQTLKAYGAIGVGVQVLDYMSDSWRKCGVSSIMLYANDSLVFHSLLDEFSFGETRYLNAHIDYAEKLASGKVIQRSYVLPNNRLSIYKKKGSYSLFVHAGERYNMKYVITDVSGNVSEMVFTIIGEEPGNPVESSSDAMELVYNESYDIDTLNLKINVPSYALYDNMHLLIHRDNDTGDGMLAPIYTVGDEHVPVHKFISLAIAVPDSLMALKDKLCMAGVGHSGKIFSMGGKYEDGYVVSSTRNFGRITLAADTLAPTVKLSKAPAGNNYGGRSSINVHIADDFSGVDSYDCYIDGQWALFEYDSKRKLLIGNFRDIDISKGKHQLMVKVVDGKGNENIMEVGFIR